MANNQIEPAKSASVGGSRMLRAFVRITPSEDGNGIHIGLAHLDRHCTYLMPYSNTPPGSEVAPITGPILRYLRVCAKCGNQGGWSVDVPNGRTLAYRPARRAVQPPGRVLLLGPATGERECR